MPAPGAEASWHVALNPGPPFGTLIRKANPSAVQEPEGNGWARIDQGKGAETGKRKNYTDHSAFSYEVCLTHPRVKLLLAFKHLAERDAAKSRLKRYANETNIWRAPTMCQELCQIPFYVILFNLQNNTVI